MDIRNLLAPLFAQIILTFGMLLTLAWYRLNAIRGRKVRIKDIALGQNAWDEKTLRVGRCFQNQLETPILFYLLIVLIILLQQIRMEFVVFSWAFVVFRILHALELINKNHVPRRFLFFLISSLSLIGMWLYFGIIVFI